MGLSRGVKLGTFRRIAVHATIMSRFPARVNNKCVSFINAASSTHPPRTLAAASGCARYPWSRQRNQADFLRCQVNIGTVDSGTFKVLNVVNVQGKKTV